jgi:DNA replication protein DnaC
MTTTTMDRLHETLEALGLSASALLLEASLEQAATDSPAYADFLNHLLEQEVTARRERAKETRLKMAHFPYVKTLAQFDFAFQKSIDERQIKELQTLRFAHEAQNVIFLGPPGVGKTHLCVALALEAITAGFSAYFITTQDLVADLARAARSGQLEKRLRIYVRPKVLVIDEMGYLPLDEMGATLLFQVVSARYERGAILLTSNKSYRDWGSIFGDQVLATAVLDRLLHHATTVNIKGESYRLRERKKAGLSTLPAVDAVMPEASRDTSEGYGRR